jgi:hypothetical protein
MGHLGVDFYYSKSTIGTKLKYEFINLIKAIYINFNKMLSMDQIFISFNLVV